MDKIKGKQTYDSAKAAEAAGDYLRAWDLYDTAAVCYGIHTEEDTERIAPRVHEQERELAASLEGKHLVVGVDDVVRFCCDDLRKRFEDGTGGLDCDCLGWFSILLTRLPGQKGRLDGQDDDEEDVGETGEEIFDDYEECPFCGAEIERSWKIKSQMSEGE